jgi:hypothetical protein
MKQGVDNIVDGGMGTALCQQSAPKEHAERTNQGQSHRENDYSSPRDWPTNSIKLLTIGVDQGVVGVHRSMVKVAPASKYALLTKSDLDFATGLGKN